MHGLFQSLRDLYRKPHGFVRRERALKGFSVNLLHYQIVWTDIVELADVWMAQCGDGTGFAAESLPVLALQACDGRETETSATPGTIAGNELDVALQNIESQRAGIQA